MTVQHDNYGMIDISTTAVATIANQAIHQCYGVVGMADKNLATGWPVTVLSRGDVVCDNGELLGVKGRGQFLECGPPEPVRPRGERAWT